MSQSSRKYCVVGDYMVGKQIGAGSFSTVWHARHRVHGTEVAIKEIVTARLNPKLQESLKSEIFILKRIDHPNIIRLHDMIEESGKIYIILEYCRGGDLSMYIQQHHGGIPEATAKHFMQQLAEGLKVLRDNSLIHRDLKPQNLLLSSKGENSTLKIADFGFARSLQPRGLAETLCGSPLYMAPEIMQLQKYDAKADLWSVGAILFQLVTGKPPFTGINQIQLLQNIVNSTELRFPPGVKDLSPECIDLCKKLLRSNPVERLTFEEFFTHPYLSESQPAETFRRRQSERVFAHSQSTTNPEQGSQDDCLPFTLDDDTTGPDANLSLPEKSSLKSTYGFSLHPKNDSSVTNRADTSKFRIGAPYQTEATDSGLGNLKSLRDSVDATDFHPKDSLELIDQDYVIVSGTQFDSLTSVPASKEAQFPLKFCSPPDRKNREDPANDLLSDIDGAIGRVSYGDRLSSHGISPRSMDAAGTSDQPSSDSFAQISSLQCCAVAITELVNSKIEMGKQLEAFSVQLVILSIWKQALHICHTQETTRLKEVSKVSETFRDTSDKHERVGLCLDIESSFLHEVELAEELAQSIDPGSMEMPDALELIYQSALTLGRHGAVDEYMGNAERATVFYSKAVTLLQFLLVEAPSLILNPPFSLTNSDRYRIQNYIDVLTNRQNISMSRRIEILNSEQDHPSSSSSPT